MDTRPYFHVFERLTKQALACIDAGKFDQLDALISDGASQPRIICRLARRGCYVQVKRMLEKNSMLIHAAARGFALNGDVKHVDELIQKGADRGVVARAYAQSLRIELAASLISNDVSFETVLKKYEDCSHLSNGKKVLMLLVLTQCEKRRELIEEKARKHLYQHDVLYLTRNSPSAIEQLNSGMKFPSLSLIDKHVMRKSAQKVHYLMQEQQLGLHESLTIMKPNMLGAIIWLLQGANSQYSPMRLPLDVLIGISSYVFELSHQEMNNLSQYLCRNTYEGALEKIRKKHQPGTIVTAISFFWTSPYQQYISAEETARANLDKLYQGSHRRIGAHK